MVVYCHNIRHDDDSIGKQQHTAMLMLQFHALTTTKHQPSCLSVCPMDGKGLITSVNNHSSFFLSGVSC
jgi:hypothetical protein